MLPRSSSCIAKHSRAIDRLLIGALCLMMIPLAVFSQTVAGLTGTVTDSSGAVMPGAKVTLTSSETGAQREGATNESGFYEFTALLPGGDNPESIGIFCRDGRLRAGALSCGSAEAAAAARYGEAIRNCCTNLAQRLVSAASGRVRDIPE